MISSFEGTNCSYPLLICTIWLICRWCSFGRWFDLVFVVWQSLEFIHMKTWILFSINDLGSLMSIHSMQKITLQFAGRSFRRTMCNGQFFVNNRLIIKVLTRCNSYLMRTFYLFKEKIFDNHDPVGSCYENTKIVFRQNIMFRSSTWANQFRSAFDNHIKNFKNRI